MITTTCEFYNPYYFDVSTKELLPFNDGDSGTAWNYKSWNCTSTDNQFTLIQNSETGAEFYVDKTLNYGEAMILWFLTIFLIVLIFEKAYNFFWKK